MTFIVPPPPNYPLALHLPTVRKLTNTQLAILALLPTLYRHLFAVSFFISTSLA